MSFRDTFKSTHSTDELLKALKTEGKNKYVDERFWKPTIDPKSGQGGALIRFLPSKHNKTPFVRIYEHSFQGPTGQWYIEKSLTTLGMPDPVSEYNSEQWATGDKAKQDEVRKRKRKTSFITNIYVLKDPANPENNGKVFLFKFGKKIYDKIMKLLEPPQDGITETKSIDPFDLYDGCNFALRIKVGEGGYPNYDDSSFDSNQTPLFKNDSDMEKVYNLTYNLDEFLDPSTYKSYDELKQRFAQVMGMARPVAALENAAPAAQKKSSPKLAEPSAVEDEDDDVDQLLSKIGNIEDDDAPF